MAYTRKPLSVDEKLDDALCDFEMLAGETITQLQDMIKEVQKAKTSARVMRMNIAKKLKVVKGKGIQ